MKWSWAGSSLELNGESFFLCDPRLAKIAVNDLISHSVDLLMLEANDSTTKEKTTPKLKVRLLVWSQVLMLELAVGGQIPLFELGDVFEVRLLPSTKALTKLGPRRLDQFDVRIC